MIDLRNGIEKLREERAAKVIELYKDVRANAIGSNRGVICYIVEQLRGTPYNITEMGAYHILKKNGLLKKAEK